MKVLIAVPTFENIYPDTFKSIYELDRGGHEVVFDFIRGYDCATARNNIVNCAKSRNADYMLMVDNDVVLQSDALVNLMEHGEDVVLGFYAHRNAENVYDGKTSVTKLGEFNYTNQFTADELHAHRLIKQNKIQIHGGGMGCALIKTSVFDKFDYPWFKWINYTDGGVLSEDLYFCEQCNQVGIPIYVDSRVYCGHILRATYWAK